MPPPADAGAPADAAPPQVQLNVVISGGGSVRTSVGPECTKGTCTYHVPVDTEVTLVAVNHGKNVFQSWQGQACGGQPQTCQLTATAPITTASVLFSHDD